LSNELFAWLAADCRWVNTLVDRIVPGPPRAHPLLGTDPLLLSAEPFALWAVETESGDFPFAAHPAVVLSRDIRPYTLRKVRLLNGAHSALVMRAAGTGLETVRECLENPEIGTWLEEMLFEEIVPVLEGRCEDPAGFARATLDRFRNPFLEHRLSAIALNHEAKVAVRLAPTLREYRERFGKDPARLAALIGG
jgi:tagaturonate reductase